MHKKVCENNYFCEIVMPSEDTKMLEFNQYQKSDKAPSIIYEDFGSFIKQWMDVKKILRNLLQQK